ncbi:MAG TPA: polysaccharide deacetylase family protein [Methanosarcina sp.]|nr:polysaccharide deacetylase family protein [Methanosarcina sp.]
MPTICGSSFSVYRDVEEFFETWKERYDYLTDPTLRVLDIMDEFQLTATFFIVADTVERYPGLIESIAERGHEIACHGLHHSCVIDHPRLLDFMEDKGRNIIHRMNKNHFSLVSKSKRPEMSVQKFESDTLKAKQILQKISGEKVVGYRAPNALVNGWMLDSLEKIGFEYDSSVSVNSLYKKTDSPLTRVSSTPYYPVNNSLEAGPKRNFIEFPWAYYDIGVKIPTSGGPMLRVFGSSIILKGLKQSLKRGHSIFYFHPIDISREKFPKLGKWNSFYWLFKGELIERRVRQVLRYIKQSGTKCQRITDIIPYLLEV